MKLISFTYKKADGTISKREIIEVSPASNLVSGIDVSELDYGDFEYFVGQYKELLDKQRKEYNELMVQFDLTHSYRQFKPEGMSNVVLEHV